MHLIFEARNDVHINKMLGEEVFKGMHISFLRLRMMFTSTKYLKKRFSKGCISRF